MTGAPEARDTMLTTLSHPSPTDEEIHGIDVLDLELAVRCLWKENIYAEAAMGCTGPVVKLAGSSLDKARAVLTASGYL